MLNLFVVLLYVSLIESYRLLAVTAGIVIAHAVFVCGQKEFIHLIKPVLPFVILMLLSLTLNDFHFMLMMIGKVMVSSILIGTLVAKYSAAHLVNCLANMGLPPIFNRILTLTFRYFHMAYEDVLSVKKALDSRGINERKGLTVAGIYGEWLGGFFLKSALHSERIYHAMKSRGYDGETQNAFLLSRKHMVESFLLIIVLTVILVIDRKV